MGFIERTVKVIACGINSLVQQEFREGRVRSLFREPSLLICTGDTEEVWISANIFHVPRVNIQQHKAKYTQQPVFFHIIQSCAPYGSSANDGRGPPGASTAAPPIPSSAPSKGKRFRWKWDLFLLSLTSFTLIQEAATWECNYCTA